MIVQIYEIQTPEEALEMVQLGVDHIGSVIQSIEKCQDQNLKDTVNVIQQNNCKSSLIPLFDKTDAIISAVAFFQPDIIHLCDTLPMVGDVVEKIKKSVEQQTVLRKQFPNIRIMRSIPIGTATTGTSIPSLRWAFLLEPVTDFFLTDTLLTKTESHNDENVQVEQPVNGFVGITGKTCDWHIARQLVQQSRIPVVLAGGIGPENVQEAVRLVKPFGVDSCTLTNAVDEHGMPIRFKKDLQKVRSLINAAQSNLS